MNYELHLGDCLEVLRGLPANCIDSVVTDPPYGIRFMGKSWAVRTSKTAPRTGQARHSIPRRASQNADFSFLSLVRFIPALGCKATKAHIFF
ncbi:hypothetical protein ACDH53_23785 [Pseudomonas tremae]|uniref:Site-specific DNA-methyltransferase n=1 Tax=Pseudomonas tremae TaxID=200454 RepID=A0ABV4PLN8_9PSED